MIIIDLEASGLLEDSYPIEVAWGGTDADVVSHLIKPEAGWTHWSSEAEKVHRISRDHLQAHGTATSEVAKKVHAELAGIARIRSAGNLNQFPMGGGPSRAPHASPTDHC